MEDLIKELQFYGNVEIIKNDYVFTLLITKKEYSYSLTTGMIPMKILELVTNYLNGEKPHVEVMKNDSNFYLLILKP